MPKVIFAAVGCTLSDPDRDIKRFFPESTGYKTDFITVKQRGGDILIKEVEEKLKDKLDPIFETADVAHAYYTVLKGEKIIGRVHGINQKGIYGGMQLILATDLEGRILEFYYQKISSLEANKFKSKEFTDQFKGLTLADFYHHDSVRETASESGRIAKIKDPSGKSSADFKITLRGIKENLILLDIFWLNRKYDNYFNKIKNN